MERLSDRSVGRSVEGDNNLCLSCLIEMYYKYSNYGFMLLIHTCKLARSNLCKGLCPNQHRVFVSADYECVNVYAGMCRGSRGISA